MCLDKLGTLGDGSGVELEQAPGVTLMGQNLRATMERIRQGGHGGLQYRDGTLQLVGTRDGTSELQGGKAEVLRAPPLLLPHIPLILRK